MINMFGREYVNHLDTLIQSFEQINENYQNKIKTDKKVNLVEKLKKLYISVFGIPEIGFQIRCLYFKKILIPHLLNRNINTILDAGSGIGSYTLLLGKMFTNTKVIGGDIDKYKLQSCKTIAKELNIKNVEFEYLDITKTSNNAIYDLAVCIDVLEHIHNYKSALKNLSKLLRSGGYLYIHVPQPNQKRIFNSLKNWHHEDHANEGIIKSELEQKLKKLGFKIIVSRETFSFFGKLSWELNHLTLSKSFVLAGIIFPFLYVLALPDLLFKNKDGLGIAVLAQKK